jgi:flap endonuclease-1
MGTKITELLISKEIGFSDLKGKVLVVDGYNIMYQFLSSLRMADGSPLKDSKGNITSHLNGLFLRSSKLMRLGMKLAFVFDGEPPELKKKERERRKEIKIEAQKKYDEALAENDIEAMRKYSVQTTRLTKEMVSEAKELLEALGIPIIQAPSEGEAQAAHIVKSKHADIVVSQDADSLLFGAPIIVRNLTITQKKKKTNVLAYETVKPILINLDENLKELDITQDQLIALSMLVGTDFNPGGIKGIGPKKGLSIIKEYEMDFEALFSKVEWDKNFDYVTWKEVFSLFKNMPVTNEYSIKWNDPHKERILEILCDRHEFNRERVIREVDELLKERESKSQKGLGDFF